MEYLSLIYLISCLSMIAYIKQNRDELLINFYMSNDENISKEMSDKEKESTVRNQLMLMVLFSPIVWIFLLKQ